MCLQPVKVLPKRYYSEIISKGKFKQNVLYSGQIYNDNQQYSYYPCGKCYECRECNIESWQIRWREELAVSEPNTSYMLTLTYKPSKLPIMDSPLGKISVLRYSDVQKFLKRLRKYQSEYCKLLNIPNPKIVYHGSGEYGTKATKRPHYHLLITNVVVPSNQFEKIWQNGSVHIGDRVDQNTIKYVLKYTLKHSLTCQKKVKVYSGEIQKINGYAFPEEAELIENYLKVLDPQGRYYTPQFTEQEVDLREYMCTIIAPNQPNEYRIAEKTFMSKGIGRAFFTTATHTNYERIQFYKTNMSATYWWDNYTKDGRGKSKPLPRYYKEMVFNPNKLNDLGKVVRDEYNRPLKLYSPLSEEFESSPRFKKMVYSYTQEQKRIKQIQYLIDLYGLDYYLESQKFNKDNKIQKYKSEQIEREKLQESKNKFTRAELVC